MGDTRVRPDCGRYADASYEALDYYLTSGWREANMYRS